MPAATIPTPITTPMRQSGALDAYEQKIVNPAIGVEFPNIDLVEVLEAPNSDELLRDIGISVAERGVAMFRNQTRLDSSKHRELVDRVCALSGRPKENGIVKHALHQIYGDDAEVAALTPERLMMRFGFGGTGVEKRQNHAQEWHRDHAYEPNPPAISSLRVEQLPLAGGDTMWASSYELFDRMSKPLQTLLESLTATWRDSDTGRAANKPGIYTGPRGSPLNVGFGVEETHPAVRTHPITGFKALYAWGTHCLHFNGVTKEESQMLMEMIEKLVVRNHDLQCRFGWENAGDIALWDNRCVMHCATMDVVGKRLGFRVLSAGERPYLDPASTGREEARATLKAMYDAKLKETKEAAGKSFKEKEGVYENGKLVNGVGKMGINVVGLREVLAGGD